KLALAAVAASRALFAAMIRAGVLGAMHADVSRGLVADATNESHRFRHGLGSVLLGEAAGGLGAAAGRGGACRTRFPRQRCASLSTIWNSCSLVSVRSVMYCRSWSRLVELAAITLIIRSPTAGFWYRRTPS